MQFFDFTIRFDDELHTLTSKNGLPILHVAELLHSLSKALNPASDEKIVLSEIKGNCYALNISTNSITKHEELKVIHRRISENDYTGLNADQRKYASKLKSIMGDRYSVSAYDNEKVFNVEVIDVKLPTVPEYFYEISAVYGIITAIGGRSITGKAMIHISGLPFDIEVSSAQEKSLLPHFKKSRLRLLIQKKISTETREIKSGNLESFEVTGQDKLYTLRERLLSKYPDLSFYNPEDEEN